VMLAAFGSDALGTTIFATKIGPRNALSGRATSVKHSWRLCAFACHLPYAVPANTSHSHRCRGSGEITQLFDKHAVLVVAALFPVPRKRKTCSACLHLRR
jgi:hypothetical protein